jgi:hypothetical protein
VTREGKRKTSICGRFTCSYNAVVRHEMNEGKIVGRRFPAKQRLVRFGKGKACSQIDRDWM